MATINQIQKGFARFIDTQIAGAFTGWQKAVVVGGATLLAANFPNIVKEYANHPIIAAMGIYNPESGMVDIEALYNAFTQNMGDEKIPVTIPQIGTIKIGRNDIEVLYRYIKEA